MTSKYEQRAVLFLDVLGFKRLINERREDLIEDVLAITTGPFQSNFEVTAFSDNMVVSTVLRRGYELSELIGLASSLSLLLLHKGVMSRGGIAVGEIKHSGNIVYGPALVKAYQLESQVANYPRIVIARDAVEKFLQLMDNPAGAEESIRQQLRTDFDGWEHVHIFDHKASMLFHEMLPAEALGKPGPICFKALIDAKAKAARLALSTNSPSDDRSLSKHEWLRLYLEQYEALYTQWQATNGGGQTWQNFRTL